jgi:salicylate hydroxylase
MTARAPLSAAVIGGGIGGLTAALALRQAGLDVRVFEQASALGEIGAGIQISPNATRILHGLGLAEALAVRGVRPVAVHQRRWDDGRTLLRVALGAEVEAAFGAPYYHFHRADLLAALAAGFPADRVHLGHRLVDLDERGDRVKARFDNGVAIDTGVLIGADGIHSRVREWLLGPERPRFTGCVAYRGLVPAQRVAHLDLEVVASNWMGPGQHFVHYWVAGARLMNCVGILERDSWTRESWTDRGEVADALAAYAGWHPRVRELIGALEETFIWALFDRDPLPTWTKGRVALLGDACHAMLPFMAQGAAQAIEDGAALAACLGRADAGDDVPTALRRYEAARKPRATRLQEMSRANKTRFHLADGPTQEARDALMASGGDRSIDAIRWLYGHDATRIAGN